MYHNISYVLKKLLNDHRTCVQFENRPEKYMFGIKNYGDIPGLINKSDGDPWDVFAPGYDVAITKKTPLHIGKVIGIFFLENGNHKIAIRIKGIPIESTAFENRKIREYCNRYVNYTKVNGVYMKL